MPMKVEEIAEEAALPSEARALLEDPRLRQLAFGQFHRRQPARQQPRRFRLTVRPFGFAAIEG